MRGTLSVLRISCTTRAWSRWGVITDEQLLQLHRRVVDVKLDCLVVQLCVADLGAAVHKLVVLPGSLRVLNHARHGTIVFLVLDVEERTPLASACPARMRGASWECSCETRKILMCSISFSGAYLE